MKEKLIEEAKKLAGIALYLAVLLGGFATYERLILEEHGISYFRYGYAVVESLVLAKIILVGDMLHLGKRFDDKPLIIPTLHKTFSFSILVLVFTVLEHALAGVVRGKDLAAVFQEIASKGRDSILAKIVVMFIAFIPMFAIRETGRVLGGGKLFDLFFKPRPRNATG